MPAPLLYEEWAQVALPPDLEVVSAAVDRLRQGLLGQGAPAPTVEGIRLAVTEALTNSIKHGRAANDGPVIRLRWHWSNEWLEIQVSEPGSFQPPARWTDLPDDPMVESGRGGFLMAGQFDSLDHENQDGRHTLRLRKRLGPPPLTAAAAAELEKTLGAMTEDLSASYETLSALFKLAEALATTEGLPEFVEYVLRVQTLVDADSMYVRLRNEAGELAVVGSAQPFPGLPATIATRSPWIEAEVFNRGQERTVDAQTTLAADDPLRSQHGIAFVCPVYFQARQLGVCVVSRRDRSGYFTAAQISLIRTTSEFLGIACANAEARAQRLAQLRVQRELEIAAQIQQSLVPREFPNRRDWRVHGLCTNALEAGGDFFDVLETPAGVLLVIADVMGKGVPAALLAVVLRTAIRAHTGLAAHPGELLTRVSVQIAPDLERLGMFITAQAVFLEAGSSRVVYANAGHCPILVLPANGDLPRTLDEGGTPLGVSHTEQYSAHETRLARGERLLLLTDGIIEAERADGSRLGLDDFAREALRLRPLELSRVCAALVAFVARIESHQTDDRTLLAVQSLA
jgi:serine phosphatase RsbU (regulator of sigma subunit)/anti-sigma regulatory factor (Ser/Thr protein kinase)